MEGPNLAGRLKFTSVCAALEKRGYRREEIKHLTRWYVLRVLGHEESMRGELVMQYHRPPDAPPPMTWEQQAMRKLRANKCPEHMRAARLEHMRVRRELAIKAIGGG